MILGGEPMFLHRARGASPSTKLEGGDSFQKESGAAPMFYARFPWWYYVAMHIIVIVGGPGSGKSTLARHISQSHNVEHIELDALFHKEN